MAYTAPKTWAYKESLSSADMNTYVRDNFIALIDRFYPVGSYYFNGAVSTNPATLLGFGTWVAVAGKVLVGLDATQTEFYTLLETGGEKTHLLTGAESGEKGHNHLQNPHNHQVNNGAETTSSGYFADTNNGNPGLYTLNTTATNIAVPASNASSAHNNLQPYEVAAIWRRLT